MNKSRILLIAILGLLLAPQCHSEILVYKADLRNASGTQINDGKTTAWGQSNSSAIVYYIMNLDGIDSTKRDILTYNGKQYVTGILTVDPASRMCIKEVDDSVGANVNDVDKTIYGRCRNESSVFFNFLYMQRDVANQSGTHDTGIGSATGLATLQNIGGGISGYYANSLLFTISRLDGSFDGSRGGYQDGRQWKKATLPMNLDTALTKAANDRGLNKVQTMNYICGISPASSYRIKLTYSNSSGDIGFER